MTPFQFIINALAVYRLTRLVTTDTITEPLRTRLAVPVLQAPEKHPIRQWLVDLVNCNWCSSIWIGAGVVALWHFTAKNWIEIALALALAAVAGIIGSREN